ncbi:hypothetical protein PC129_g20749 [Phytophthora cactorum]|uniref:Uncharacterized protein n=1 Tax=Phytophthora cactorum TaxID=29920 RepID=A0A329RLK3_9STRA|nr:hypothetical protein PC117_g23382 [Phytophthora cactorum]KAG3208221.1 hypothetical protein PC129_g20749 [Phytophthora cactorum]RAW24038.1 hypothetical protein PC110_g19530 [Phytophthora cactorum]
MTGLKPLLLLPWKTSLSYYLSPTVLSGYASKTKAPMIEIGKGQMLILRGGLPHAGATFDEANLCLHCYIRGDGVDQEEYTKAVTWECFRCSPIYSDAILSAIS